LNIVQPTTLYLGQKDAAQCVMIRRIVNDLNLNVNIDVVPTVRESDGLALSSRNAYLTPREREAAPILYKSLCAARNIFDAQKIKEGNSLGKESLRSSLLYNAVESVLRSETLVSGIHYISIDNRETMRPLDNVILSEGAFVSIACQVGNVRLIDNIVLS
jgi:pantoate--beta-alanine ligase